MLEVRLLGRALQRKREAEIATGERLHCLAEISWVPPAIFANSQLAWREVDTRTIEIATDAADKGLRYG